jgi:hypothetical protein
LSALILNIWGKCFTPDPTADDQLMDNVLLGRGTIQALTQKCTQQKCVIISK